MKNAIKISALFALAIAFNSCALFGGGKSKCGDCPTWSQIELENDQNKTVEVENV